MFQVFFSFSFSPSKVIGTVFRKIPMNFSYEMITVSSVSLSYACPLRLKIGIFVGPRIRIFGFVILDP